MVEGQQYTIRDFRVVGIFDPRIMEGRGWALVIRDGGPFPSHRQGSAAPGAGCGLADQRLDFPFARLPPGDFVFRLKSGKQLPQPMAALLPGPRGIAHHRDDARGSYRGVR